jgi:hypothetical protein
MSKQNTQTSGGIGFFGLLGIVFIVLKLTGVIDWSWWWVTAPLWGGVALVIAVVVLIFGGAFVIDFFDRGRKAKRRN